MAPARWRTTLTGAGTEVHIYQPAGKWDFTNLVMHRERLDEAKKRGSMVVVAMCDIFLLDVDAIDALKALVAAKTPLVGLQEGPAAACAKQPWFAKARADGTVEGGEDGGRKWSVASGRTRSNSSINIV